MHAKPSLSTAHYFNAMQRRATYPLGGAAGIPVCRQAGEAGGEFVTRSEESQMPTAPSANKPSLHPAATVAFSLQGS